MTGKNRPLEPEEIAFMDRLLEEEAERERQKKIYEDQGLDEYRVRPDTPTIHWILVSFTRIYFCQAGPSSSP